MSFVIAQPEQLSGAAGDLQGIGSGVQAQSAATAGPTT
ncbi:MAG TPA: PE family protein, partial [Mycobacterium sp.]|nr:PE family protein [Mycobacterium sp.]